MKKAILLSILTFTVGLTTLLVPVTLNINGIEETETTISIIEETETETETEEIETETETTESIEETETETETVPKYISLGTFRITAYCACVKCCSHDHGITASGTRATQGRTIAVDPKQFPYGTELIFNGHTYVAEDCGSGINQNCIDLYFESHQEALEWGVQYHEVFMIVFE